MGIKRCDVYIYSLGNNRYKTIAFTSKLVFDLVVYWNFTTLVITLETSGQHDSRHMYTHVVDGAGGGRRGTRSGSGPI